MANARNQVETRLVLSEQPAQLDRGTSVEVTVDTNADNYTVELENNKISFEKKDNNILKLTGVSDGLCQVKVKATAPNGTEKVVIWYCNVIVIPTTLECNNNPSELNLGEKIELNITTNAGSFTIESLDPDVIKVGSKPNQIIASSLGNTKVFIKATKQHSVEKVIQWDLAVKYVKPVVDNGTPSNIKLVNTGTKRIVTLATTDNESVEDITVSLPRKSGILITEESLQSTSRVITRPYIMQPVNGAENFTGKFMASPYEVGVGYQAGHKSTIWQCASDVNFTRVVYEKEVVPETIMELQSNAIFQRQTTKEKDLTQTVMNLIGTFYVRCKYKSENFESDWSQPVYVNLGINPLHGIARPTKVYNHPEAGNWTSPKGVSKIQSWYDGAYFGVVPHNQLVPDYDYRGTFNTIKNEFDPSRYTNVNEALQMIKFKKGYQVVHDNKLWYALQEITNASKEAMVVPGTDDTKWKVDTRTALGAPAVVHDMIGIGHGIVDNNHNAMSKDGTSIGAITGHEEGYLKYIYKGRLCYTTPKPTCEQIAWTDLMQRELAHQQRTIRLGKHLFRVRLPYEDEFSELFTRMCNGVYDTKTTTDLKLDKKVWVYDTQEGAARKVMSFGDKSSEDRTVTLYQNVKPGTKEVLITGKYGCIVKKVPSKLTKGKYYTVEVEFIGGANCFKVMPELADGDNSRTRVQFKFSDTNKQNGVNNTDKGLQLYCDRIGSVANQTISFVAAKEGEANSSNSIDYSTALKAYKTQTNKQTLTSEDIALVRSCFTADSESYESNAPELTVTCQENEPTAVVSTLDPKSRSGSYRYVLEYIPEECAPYKNLNFSFGANIPKANNELFLYDPYTDVGFFGVVNHYNLIHLDTLSSRVGFTSGSAQYGDAGFLKFYWHGMMIYIAKKPPRYNVSWNHIKNHNCQYGWDTGTNDKKFLDINGITYRCSNILGARKSPYDHTKMNYNLSNGAGKIPVTNVINENYKYSMWGECIMRIGDCYGGYGEINETTFKNELDEIGGIQLGDHFQKFATTEIQVRYDRDGNGTACWSREVGSGSYTIHLGYRGFGEWGCVFALSVAHTGTSWRPVLMLDANY